MSTQYWLATERWKTCCLYLCCALAQLIMTKSGAYSKDYFAENSTGINNFRKMPYNLQYYSARNIYSVMLATEVLWQNSKWEVYIYKIPHKRHGKPQHVSTWQSKVVIVTQPWKSHWITAKQLTILLSQYSLCTNIISIRVQSTTSISQYQLILNIKSITNHEQNCLLHNRKATLHCR